VVPLWGTVSLDTPRSIKAGLEITSADVYLGSQHVGEKEKDPPNEGGEREKGRMVLKKPER